MKVDLYVRVVLTVIAVCLVGLCLGKMELTPKAEAQPTAGTIGRYQFFAPQATVLLDTKKGEMWYCDGDPRKDKWAKKRIVR